MSYEKLEIKDEWDFAVVAAQCGTVKRAYENLRLLIANVFDRMSQGTEPEQVVASRGVTSIFETSINFVANDDGYYAIIRDSSSVVEIGKVGDLGIVLDNSLSNDVIILVKGDKKGTIAVRNFI